MKPIVFLIQFFIAVACVAQTTPEEYVRQADQAFAENKYNQAIDDYKKVVEMGFESPGLYYSLGNACYRVNNFPAAILYYEKSLKLEPGNEDLAFNLKVARSKIVDKIAPLPQPFYERVWLNAQKLFTIDGWAVLIIILVTLVLCCAALFLITTKQWVRKTVFWLGFLILVGCLSSSMISAMAYRNAISRQEAIIFDPSVAAKSSPEENSTDIFVLHEGTKVEIQDQIGEWYEIRIADGNSGWVKSKVLQKI